MVTFNAAQQGRYQRWSWKIPRVPPACPLAFALAGFRQAHHPNQSRAVPWSPGAGPAHRSEGQCGRCYEENRPAPCSELDRLALPLTRSRQQRTEWLERFA